MPRWSRIFSLLRGNRARGEIEEEFESHIEEAMAQGRDPGEARRAYGSVLRRREESRDIRPAAWLDAFGRDAVFGWRQIKKSKISSAAAILSLGLALGACTSAFRLIDALLLRPLPIAEPHRLYAISYEGSDIYGKPSEFDSSSYPLFRQLRAATKGDAELIAASNTEPRDLTFRADQDMEKANVQYVSGNMFGAFGLLPAAGRLLTNNDDVTPGAHPYAVLSANYWRRRFGGDPSVVGRSFRMGDDLFRIAGVCAGPFNGAEPGIMTDIFIPTVMNAGSIASANSFWFRIFVRPQPGVSIPAMRAKLNALYRAHEQERAKGFINFPKHLLEGYPRVHLVIKPAAAGVSQLQNEYRSSLVTLGVLVLLVLLIACANVANLMTAQAAARTREMALRMSIGAGKRHLVQLVVMENAMVTMLAAGVGAMFAWWSAPLVVGMISPSDNPVRLALAADWRVLAFGAALTLGVAILLGLVPALRSAAVQPVEALKGGSNPHARRRMMHAVIAAQVAFCFLVLFVAGLFVGTFDRLTHHPMGFSAERILTLDTVAQGSQPAAFWSQVAEHVRGVPGVERVAVAGWPLMSGIMRNNFVSIHGAPPGEVLTFFLQVSPGWLDTMKIPLVDGRDLRPEDAGDGAAIVNRTFARQYFGGEDPVGQSFETVAPSGKRTRFSIVGLAADACYRNIREPMLPVAYVPFQPAQEATLLVRVSGDGLRGMAPILRQEVPRARPGFRVSNIRTQVDIVGSQTIRERLLATLALFFAAVAILLAGIGLFGVLEYSVVQRQREISIRMALGAQATDVARRVTADVFIMVLAGAIAGLALGMVSVRWIESLFYQVRPTDVPMLAVPSIAIVAAALLAALRPVIRAVRIDPAKMLRAE